jgi:hypothetical protein
MAKKSLKISLDSIQIYPEDRNILFFYPGAAPGFFRYRVKTNVTPASINRMLEVTKKGFYRFNLGDYVLARPIYTKRYKLTRFLPKNKGR